MCVRGESEGGTGGLPETAAVWTLAAEDVRVDIMDTALVARTVAVLVVHDEVVAGAATSHPSSLAAGAADTRAR